MANDYGENSYKIFNRGINVFNRGIKDFKWEIYTAIALHFAEDGRFALELKSK